MAITSATRYADLGDLALAGLVLARDADAARHLLTANNQRLFRAAWSILLDRGEAEDAVQEGYLKAFAALATFKGESALSTWLTRIVVNEALERKRRAGRRRRRASSSTWTGVGESRSQTRSSSSAGASSSPAP